VKHQKCIFIKVLHINSFFILSHSIQNFLQF